MAAVLTQSDTKLRSAHLRELGDLERELRKLEEHPSWGILVKEFDRLRDEWKKSISNKMLVGGVKAEALDQRELDYKRGYFAGIRDVLSAHDNAKRNLENEMRKDGNG